MKIVSKIILFMLSICSFQLHAQEWQTVKLHQKNFYQCNPSQGAVWNTNAIRIDSAFSVGSDSVFLNFETIRDTATVTFPSCVNIHGASWLGSHVVVDSLGVNTFFNKNEDSIFVKTFAQIGQSWHLYNFSNGNYLEATISSLSIQLVNGIADSVKQITMQCKDSLGNTAANIFNGQSLLISKQYGIIKLVDFYNFPNDALSFSLSTAHLMTIGEIIDFNIGDEFGSGQSCSGFLSTVTLLTVLDKYFSSALDTVFYHFKREVSAPTFVQFPNPHIVYSYSIDTAVYEQITNLNQLVCTTMPGENGLIDSITATLPDQNPPQYLMDYNDSNYYCGLMSYTFNPGPYFLTNDCVSYYTFESHFTISRCIQGCGCYTTYTVDNSALPPVNCSGDLFYIHKGSFVCGTPPNMALGLSNIESNKEIDIYPNPATNEFTISNGQLANGNAVTIKIIDVTGNLIYNTTSTNQKTEVSTKDFAPGIYFVQIQTPDFVETKKLVVVK